MSMSCRWCLHLSITGSNTSNANANANANTNTNTSRSHCIQFTDALFQSFIDLLPPQEHASIHKYRRTEDQYHALLGRLCIYKFVHTITQLPYEIIYTNIKKNKYGKPMYADNQTSLKRIIEFNVSHHGEWVFFAGECRLLNSEICERINDSASNNTNCNLSQSGLYLGCDVSQAHLPSRIGKTTSDVDEYLSAFESCFSKKEWQYIMQNNNEQTHINALSKSLTLEPYDSVSSHDTAKPLDANNTSCKPASVYSLQTSLQAVSSFMNIHSDNLMKLYKFAYLWAHKESFVKAMGMGLAIPLNSFYFTPTRENSQLNDISSITNIQQRFPNCPNHLVQFLPSLTIAFEDTVKSTTYEKVDADVQAARDMARNVEWSFEQYRLDELYFAVVAIASPNGATSKSEESADTVNCPKHVESSISSIGHPHNIYPNIRILGLDELHSNRSSECHHASI